MHPVKAGQCIALQIEIANPRVLLILRVRNLIVILAQRCDPTKLILGRCVVHQRNEPAHAALLIVNHFGNRRRQAQLRPVRVHARIVSEALRVASNVELIVGLPEISARGNQLGFIVALEAGRRHNVEQSVGTVAVFTGKSAAFHLQLRDVLRINQRRNVRRDRGVHDRNAIQEPAHLMAAAHMKHVVDHGRARSEIGNHRQAVGLIRARCLRDFLRRHGRPNC